MRLDRASTVHGEPGHIEWLKARDDGKAVTVTVDGRFEQMAEAADAVEGWVRRAKLDEAGNIVTSDDVILYETVRGKVVIEVKDAQ